MEKLIKYIEIISGGTPKTSINEYWNGNIPWLSVKDFSNVNRYVNVSEKNISEIGLENSAANILHKNDIIISARGTVGRLALISKDMSFNQSCFGIRTKSDNLLQLYLYYWFLINVRQLKNQANGGVFDTIIRSSFKNLIIDIPSIQKQQHIVNIIGSIDDLIESNNMKILNLHSLCNENFKNINLDNSKRVKMNEIFNVIIGRTPPRKEKEWFSNENGFKWISISDMGKANIYITNTDEYLTNEAVDKFKVPIIQKNTILLSFKLTVGRISITTENMVTNEAIAAFTNCPENIFYYLYFYLKNFNFSNAGSTSSIAAAINSKIIKELEFIIPQEYELSKFNELVKPCFNLINNLIKINQNLQELKQKYLNKFFG